MVSIKKPIAVSPAIGEMTAEMVEGSSTSRVVEEVVAPEAVVTTAEVVAMATKAAAIVTEVASTNTEVAAMTTEVAATTTEVAATTIEVAVTTTEIATMTTNVVVGPVEEVAEASAQGGDVPDHRAGKEIIADLLPGTQRETTISESEDEEYFNFCSDFSTLR